MPKEPKRKAITHTLKCWPEFFEAIRTGTKTFEYRMNDRDYQVGDRLRLREFVPCEVCKGTGRVMDDSDGEYVRHGRKQDCGCMSGRYPKGKYTGRKILRNVTYKLVADEMVILSIVKLPPRKPKMSRPALPEVLEWIRNPVRYIPKA